MSADTQTHLFGEPSGESVSIKTSGRMVRPMMAVPDALVDEARFLFDDDGVHVSVRDPANVAAVFFDVAPATFDSYELNGEEVRTGLNLTRVTRQLRRARMGKRTDDPVELDIDKTRVLVTTEREYSQTTLTQTGEVLTIDPDSVLESPDMPDLHFPWSAEVDVDALVDAVTNLKAISDHAEVVERDGHLLMGGAGDDQDDHTGDYGHVADFGAVVEGNDADESDEGAMSVFTLDYLEDLVGALKECKADEVMVRWGEEFPLVFDFARYLDDGETEAYGGRLMMAPRIKAGDD